MVVILEGGRGSGQWGWGSRRASGGLVSRHGPLGKCVELYTYFTCTLLCVNYTSIIKIHSYLNATPRDSDLISLKQAQASFFAVVVLFKSSTSEFSVYPAGVTLELTGWSLFSEVTGELCAE